MFFCLIVQSFNCLIDVLGIRYWVVGAILEISPYSVIALLFMRQFMNCLYGRGRAVCASHKMGM